jgi:hypothetical protein
MATSKLQIEVGNLLDKYFPELTIKENYRPDWLVGSNYTKLELDFFIEELNLAFEIQGKQHYEYIPFFHNTIDDFENQKKRDQEKKDLCSGHNINLIEIFCTLDAIKQINNLNEKLHPIELPRIPEEIIKLKQIRYENRLAYEETKEIIASNLAIKKYEKEQRKKLAQEQNKLIRQKNYDKFGIIGYDLKCWKKKAKKHLGVNTPFHSSNIPTPVFDFIKRTLPTLSTTDQIDNLFEIVNTLIEI